MCKWTVIDLVAMLDYNSPHYYANVLHDDHDACSCTVTFFLNYG